MIYAKNIIHICKFQKKAVPLSTELERVRDVAYAD